MTKDEAIATLEAIKQFGMGKWIFDKEEIEAFDMAIEALSANCTTEKPNDIVEQGNDVIDTPTDIISRADAIKAFREEDVFQHDVVQEIIIAILNDIPSAEATGALDDAIAKYVAEFNHDSAIMRITALPSADRPTELLKDGTLKVNVNNGAEVNRVLVWGDDGCGGLYYADDRPNIAYFCDGAACDGECNECHHTTDIKHAKNFNIIGGKYNIKYIETDYRPSGEWVIVNKGLDIYICDQCGEVEQIQRIPIWDYCPNCGAKMGGNR